MYKGEKIFILFGLVRSRKTEFQRIFRYILYVMLLLYATILDEISSFLQQLSFLFEYVSIRETERKQISSIKIFKSLRNI